MMEDLLRFLLTPEGSNYIIGGIAALAVTMIALAFVSASYRYTRANGPWGRLASRTGLTLLPGRVLFPQREPVVSGDYDGRPLRLTWWARRSNNRNVAYYTLIERPVDHGGHLRLSPATVFSRMAEALGGNDLKIGDESFDRRINIWSTDESLPGLLLADSELRWRITAIKNWDQISLENGQLTLRLNGVVRDIGRLQEMFDLTGDIARALERLV